MKHFIDNEQICTLLQKKKDATPEVRLEKPSLAWAMVKVYFGEYIGLVAIKFTHDLLSFTKPVILEYKQIYKRLPLFNIN